MNLLWKASKTSFQVAHFPEINVFLYSINSEYLVIKSTPKFFQVSSNVYNDGKDWWELNESAPKGERTFKENFHVFTRRTWGGQTLSYR